MKKFILIIVAVVIACGAIMATIFHTEIKSIFSNISNFNKPDNTELYNQNNLINDKKVADEEVLGIVENKYEDTLTFRVTIQGNKSVLTEPVSEELFNSLYAGDHCRVCLKLEGHTESGKPIYNYWIKE